MSATARRSRRAALARLGALAAASMGASVVRAELRTPAQSEGPYYPTQGMRFNDQNADLVRIESKVSEAGGDVIMLRGTVFGPSGDPVEGARIEIWQVDVNGRYIHSRDRNPVAPDPHFQGFGFAITDTAGAYAFRTIKPVAYPGRTPHIHVKALHDGRELTTQFYIDNHPLNASDALWRRLSEAERDAVAMRFTPGPSVEETRVDIRL